MQMNKLARKKKITRSKKVRVEAQKTILKVDLNSYNVKSWNLEPNLN